MSLNVFNRKISWDHLLVAIFVIRCSATFYIFWVLFQFRIPDRTCRCQRVCGYGFFQGAFVRLSVCGQQQLQQQTKRNHTSRIQRNTVPYWRTFATKSRPINHVHHFCVFSRIDNYFCTKMKMTSIHTERIHFI